MSRPTAPAGSPIGAIAVFCGSSSGKGPVYAEAAHATGRELARRGIDVVYGGGSVGLMGAVADGALSAGGTVVGVMPRALVDREIAHTGLTDLHVVESMHQRKAMMADLSDAFLALPGGAGTLEEITEQWTWAQLGVHGKPCGFLDVAGFWGSFRRTVQRMAGDGFMQRAHAEMLLFDSDLPALLARFDSYVSPSPKWQSSALSM